MSVKTELPIPVQIFLVGCILGAATGFILGGLTVGAELNGCRP